MRKTAFQYQYQFGQIRAGQVGRNKPVRNKQNNQFLQGKNKIPSTSFKRRSMGLTGYGHGVDTQDKGAGKATTYALKYRLYILNSYQTIDVWDKEHSDEKEVPKTTAYNHKPLW